MESEGNPAADEFGRFPYRFIRTSIFSGVTRELTLTVHPRDLQAYKRGSMIQDCFPYLSADEREFIKTGATAEEWAKATGAFK